MKKNLLKKQIVVDVSKEECYKLRDFAFKYGIAFKLAELKHYEKAFPTKLVFNWNSVDKRYNISLASGAWQFYGRNYELISVSNLNNFISLIKQS